MKPILITGATGTLGGAFGRACAERGLRHHLTNRAELDIASPTSIAAALAHHRPWLVVNTAGYVRVDEAEDDAESCHRANAVGAIQLAQACAAAEIGLVTFSTDLVFDGAKGEPYDEDDEPSPLSVYGRSKAAAEAGVIAAHPEALVIRTSAFFGPDDEHNLVTRSLRALAARQRVTVMPGVVSPTYVPELVHSALDLAIDGERGLWHLANRDAITWVELIRRAATRAGIDPAGVAEASPSTVAWRAPRPAYSALSSRRGHLLGTLDDALGRYVEARAGAWW